MPPKSDYLRGILSATASGEHRIVGIMASKLIEEIRTSFLRNLGVGVLTLIPVFGSIYVFFTLLAFSDNFLFNLLPESLQPQNLFGFRIPGLGLFLTVAIIFSTGVFARNYLGKQALSWMESVLKRIPGVNTLYSAFRQLTESIFMDRANAFRKVVMIEFPLQGTYSLGFVTHSLKNPNKEAEVYAELFTIFVPTTPNPTSGFFMVVPDWAVHEVNISVQEAFRLIVSGGVLAGSGDLFKKIERSITPSLLRRKPQYTGPI